MTTTRWLGVLACWIAGSGYNVYYAKFNQNATSCSWSTRITSMR